MSDTEITPRLLLPSQREVEVEAGRTYRFVVRAHRRIPEITNGQTEVAGDRPLPRQIVPVVSLEGSFTATVHDLDLAERSIFVILDGVGSLQLWADAIVGVEEVEDAGIDDEGGGGGTA